MYHNTNHTRISQSSYQPQHIPLPQIILKQLQSQQQQLSKIRQQQHTLTTIDENIRKKNTQISLLKQQVQKYQIYYKKYTQLSYQYNQKLTKLAQKQKQLSILMKQLQDLIQQNDQLQQKLITIDKQRSQLVKQQRQIQRVNTQIEQTFILYQQQCKRKEMNLLRDLQKAYKQVTQLNKRIDNYEMRMFQNQQLKKKLSQKINQQNMLMSQSLKLKQQQQQNKINNQSNNNDQLANNNKTILITQLRQQNEHLKYLLSTKQDQLTKYKILNHQLSIQFDKSVSKICDFEKQLTKYRQQNHQLQKMLTLFVSKQKYQKLHLRQLQKVNQRKKNESYCLIQQQHMPQQQQSNGNNYNHTHHYQQDHSNKHSSSSDGSHAVNYEN